MLSNAEKVAVYGTEETVATSAKQARACCARRLRP